jgi:uncharacterized phage protein (TIGR01671 family)
VFDILIKKNKNKMERTIKFRGKSISGEWVYGDLIQLDTQLCIAKSHQWAGVPANNSIEIDVTKIVPETVGQFTGLKDRNGVKIYEGDVIQYETDYDLMRFEVKWNKDTLMWEAVSQVIVDEPLYYKNGFIEIIGNIHDNPELIETI